MAAPMPMRLAAFFFPASGLRLRCAFTSGPVARLNANRQATRNIEICFDHLILLIRFISFVKKYQGAEFSNSAVAIGRLSDMTAASCAYHAPIVERRRCFARLFSRVASAWRPSPHRRFPLERL